MQFNNIVHSEKTQLKFFNSFKKMNHQFGCFYMGYILEDTRENIRSGFTTNLVWGKEYITNYINSCHLWSQVQHFYSSSEYTELILPWSTVHPETATQKEIILRRHELFIGEDGVSFCQKSGWFKEYFYFAPELNQQFFLERICQHIGMIKQEINIFRHESARLFQKFPITI